jgi:hypothetical protein
VQVVTPAGTSAVVAADKYVYEGAPTVTSVAPKSGPVGGAQAVTITGTNFTGASAVKFATSAATLLNATIALRYHPRTQASQLGSAKRLLTSARAAY